MQIKGYFNLNVWFLIAIGLIVAFVLSVTGCKSSECPAPTPAPNPLCVLTSAIEEASTCLPVKDPNGLQYEAKVTLEDKTELYCQIVKKQGLVCKPVKDSPGTAAVKDVVRQAQQQQGDTPAQGSGSAAPAAPPKATPAKPGK